MRAERGRRANGEIVSIQRDGSALARAALERSLASGGVAVFPADGLYGLACDPLDPEAIGQIHRIKGRDDGKPAAVMYFSALAMRELLGDLGPRAGEAVGALLPGPVTLVLANPAGHYPLACREDPGRLGVRLIEGPLSGLSRPVFQTSANLSGERAPASISEIPDGVLEAVDLAIDGGKLSGNPSTVIDLTGIENGEWRILREGGLPGADVARALTAEG